MLDERELSWLSALSFNAGIVLTGAGLIGLIMFAEVIAAAGESWETLALLLSALAILFGVSFLVVSVYAIRKIHQDRINVVRITKISGNGTKPKV